MILLPKNAYQIGITDNKGRGVFTNIPIKKGTVVSDYMGDLIPIQDVDFALYEDYLMYFSETHCIVPNLLEEGAHLINHSCSPNCFMYLYKNHTLFFTIRDIQKEEELTISYMYPPKEGSCIKKCPHTCSCESKNCKGTMHLSEETFVFWQQYQKKFVKKTRITSKRLRSLSSYPSIPPVDPIWSFLETFSLVIRNVTSKDQRSLQ